MTFDPKTDPNELLGRLFGEFFGMPGAAAPQVELAITDAEALAGVTRDVAIVRTTPCGPCAGRGGATPDDVRTPCAACDAGGRQQRTHGFLVVQTTCPACHGVGSVVKQACATCAGSGTSTAPATVEVTVPAGAVHCQQLVVTDGERAIYVVLRVGGRPNAHDLAMRAISLEPIPAARVIPTRAERRQATMYMFGVIFIGLAIALAMLRH
ncbi:MAG: hypothetical protein NT062_27180 [Proteobacteria bacterium]|nr:hypothetical protein [Pseudomonadota bacterium]